MTNRLVVTLLAAASAALPQSPVNATASTSSLLVMHYYVAQAPQWESREARFTPYIVVWVTGGDAQVDGYAASVSYTDERGIIHGQTLAAVKTPGITSFVFWTGRAEGISVTARPFQISGDSVPSSGR